MCLNYAEQAVVTRLVLHRVYELHVLERVDTVLCVLVAHDHEHQTVVVSHRIARVRL